MEYVEIKSYLECKLCGNPIGENNNIPRKSIQFPWRRAGRDAYVCRDCAKKLLEVGRERIIGISKPRRKELYIVKQ